MCSNTSPWLDPKDTMQAGVCMLSYWHGITPEMLCFSMQVMSTGLLESLKRPGRLNQLTLPMCHIAPHFNHSHYQKLKALTKKNRNCLSLAIAASVGRTRNPDNGQGGSLHTWHIHLLTLSECDYRAGCRKATAPMDPCRKSYPNGDTATRRTASSGRSFLWPCLFWERQERRLPDMRKAWLPDT